MALSAPMAGRLALTHPSAASTPPTITPTLITNELVLSMYGDHTGDVFSCTMCGKDEPPESEFSECGRCAGAYYCSKDCQVQHWPEHKKRCPKFNDEMKKARGKIDRRFARFDGYFGPILNQIIMGKLALLQLENEAASNTTHLVVLQLTELPKEAKKPRLRLNGVDTMALADLPDKYRSHMEHGMRQFPPGLFVIPYLVEVKFSVGGTPAMLLKPGMTSMPSNPLLDPHIPKTKAPLINSGSAWMQTLNNVAEGKQDDLWRAIKEKVKRNRAAR